MNRVQIIAITESIGAGAAQLPFLLQAVPMASLIFPPWGTPRRYWHLKQGQGRGDLLFAEADALAVGEDGVDGLALGALDVHEEGVGRLDESLELVHLEFFLGVGVEEVDFHDCKF